jgi:tetratricopeptide (TPR) repeat protein
MVFGFGFNKQKVLSAAEKFVQQGKLQNAISEYEKILKHDAKDLTVMNTIGDLYARLGENDKAAESFKNVGDAYASQGFTVKAIAMYKKLSKLKSSMECVLRLAELYTQQGLFNDARAQYLLVAEDFLKSGQLDQAVRIFEKTLEMDPDNVAMRTKLAEVYTRLGKKEEAWKILSAAAESLRNKGQLAAADEVLQRMLKLDPNSGYALALRGRAALDSGDATAAIESLSKVADLDTNPDGLRALFHAYLKAKRFDEAGAVATKLASMHNDTACLGEYADALLSEQQYQLALSFFEQHADDLLRNDPAKLSESLRGVIGHVREDTQALETLLALFQKTGENTHLSEIYELLAHAYVQSNELEKARDYYLKLTQLEPANQIHAQNYQQVLEKLNKSGAAPEITAEEGAVLVDELEATAPFIEQQYKDDLTLAIQAAMTDAELFISYNMAQKALAPLLNALPKAPRDLRLNQKLASLHTKAGRFTEAAVCCRTLESLYHDAGHAEEARRYGELAAKYEERSGLNAPLTAPQDLPATDPAVASAEPSVAPETAEFEIALPPVESFTAAAEASTTEAPPTISPKPARSGVFFHASAPVASAKNEAPPVSDFPVATVPEMRVAEAPAEVELSGDWESELSVEAPTADEAPTAEALPTEIASVDEGANQYAGMPVAGDADASQEQPTPTPSVNLQDGIEEVRFYLSQGMIEAAERVLDRMEAVAPGSPELKVLRLGIESAKQSASAPRVETEVAVDETAVAPERMQQGAAHETTPQPWPQEPPRAAAARPVLQELVSEIEESLGDGFVSQPQSVHEPEVPVAEIPSAADSAAVGEEHQFRSPGTLDEFVADLEASLGSDFVEEPAQAEAAVAPVQAQMEAPVAPPAAQALQTETPVARAAAASAAPVSISAPIHVPASPVQQAPATVASANPVADAAASVDLANMFGELKHELEEDAGASSDEDPETHYNLGVAFREMGLLDEAIGEFQKVCQAAEHGRAFSQLMQTYTWLAQCFLDKGIPEAAIRWYEKALTIPTIDQETRTALHYELASSFETAGNKTAALNNFLEVYGSNIDYRDVGERIKALRP